MRALILDMTHGGDILTERLLDQGHSVHCVDVYRIGGEGRKEELRAKGAWAGEEVPPGHYDLLVSPAHCPDGFLAGASWSERRTFHEMVGALMPEGPHRIEVTGTNGKTSSVHLLAHLLRADGRRVLLHSSRGRYLYSPAGVEELDRRVSINPVSLLTLPDIDADHVVAEVSLGGSGSADLSLITNLSRDYPIAAGSRRAKGAKASILNPEGLNLVREEELGVWSPFCPSLQAYGRCLSMDLSSEVHLPREAVLEHEGSHRLSLAPGYLQPSYLGAFDSALAVCRSLGLGADSLVDGLESFAGVPGRGEVHTRGEGTLVLDRNPGVSADSIRHRLDVLDGLGGPRPSRLLVSPVDRKVCDKLDRESVVSLAESRGLPLVWDEGGSFSLPERGMDLLFIKEGYL